MYRIAVNGTTFAHRSSRKNEEKLLARLDQAILGVIDSPEKT